ncbi:hypothetical protein C0995_003548 [Termitomyces sp. Mi166|nr:hypothetical protein C0995_003548 [Termitomyces sp. Mi166\
MVVFQEVIVGVLGSKSDVSVGCLGEGSEAVYGLKELLNVDSIHKAARYLSLHRFEGLVVNGVKEGNAFEEVLVNHPYNEGSVNQLTDLSSGDFQWLRCWYISGKGFMNESNLFDGTLTLCLGLQGLVMGMMGDLDPIVA